MSKLTNYVHHAGCARYPEICPGAFPGHLKEPENPRKKSSLRKVGIVADRESPFCTHGSEKVNIAVAVIASDPRAVALARPQPHPLPTTLVLEPDLDCPSGFVGPYCIFILKILTEFLLILRFCLKRTWRDVTEAQSPHLDRGRPGRRRAWRDVTEAQSPHQPTGSLHGILDAEACLNFVHHVLNASANQPVRFRVRSLPV